MEERHLSLSEAADVLNISERTAYRWIKSGKLRAYKPGRDYWIPESAVKAVVEESVVRPKVGAPSSQGKLFNNGLLGGERRGGATDADIINGFEGVTRDYRLSWRGALEALAAPWEERLRSGAFDRSMVEQFFTDVAAVSQGVALALSTSTTDTLLQSKYKPVLTAEDFEEIEQTDLTYAAAHILEISEKLYTAAAERFTQSELDAVRQKRDEARLALIQAA